MDLAPERRGSPLGLFRAVTRAPEFGLVVGIAVALGVIALFDRSGAFFSAFSRQTMLHQVALYGVLAVGAAVVIIAGGIDLSIGATSLCRPSSARSC
jgi:ribose/xylose/arabinose/galactoside ABC-type transport system permease subunit